MVDEVGEESFECLGTDVNTFDFEGFLKGFAKVWQAGILDGTCIEVNLPSQKEGLVKVLDLLEGHGLVLLFFIKDGNGGR